MKLLVISDLHLGNGDNFGTFGWDYGRFISVVEEIRTSYGIDTVVVNGDLYELYKYRYEDVAESSKQLRDYFEKIGYEYIRGNHDFMCEEGRDNLLIENSRGQKIYIEHGHNADFLNGTCVGRAVGRAGFSILKQIIKVPRLRELYFLINSHIDEVDRVPRKYNTYRYLKYALNLLKNYDVVILGHTHKIEVHKTYYLNQKKRYFNCGSCTLGRFQAVMLDTETLDYDTIKITSGENTSMLGLERFNRTA
ncbi:MAG: metallophosphoesterase family protein [Spirochaetota bacterium]